MAARKKQTRGTCYYCDNTYAKGGMIRHLRACSEREAAQAAAEASDRTSKTLVHLRAEDAWGADFWLDLEVAGSTTLREIDEYLRAIWLECCGHLSRFSIDGWRGDEIPKSRRVDQVFGPDAEVTHIYDFGTSSETLLRTFDVREGVPTTEHSIALMARNEPPEAECIECGEEASWFCTECLYEENAWNTFCDEHMEAHPHDAYGPPMPIVNSPRMGMCGYDGPAEPPY
jgi:hypothetical protein